MISVELTDKEAESFKKWRKYEDVFDGLLAAGVFSLRNGHASLSFNADGVLVVIRTDTEAWRRKKSLLT